MRRENGKRRGGARRRGAVLTEFALVMPIFLTLFIGMMEFGRSIMVQQILTNAAREGARKAIRPGESASTVTSSVTQYLKETSVDAASNSVTLSWTANPTATTPTWSPVTSLTAIPSQSAIRVTVTAKKSDTDWGIGLFLPSTQYSANVIMRKE